MFTFYNEIILNLLLPSLKHADAKILQPVCQWEEVGLIQDKTLKVVTQAI